MSRNVNYDQKALSSRLESIIEKNGLNRNSFAQLVGVDASNLWKKMSGQLSFTSRDFVKYREANLNVDYLITGEGEPYTGPFPKKEMVYWEDGSTQGAPVYDDDFALGFTERADVALDPIGYVDLPSIKKGDFFVRAVGDSMKPQIDNGDYVCLRQVRDWFDYITFGDTYAIVSKNELRTIKKIMRGVEEDEFTLVPVNKSEFDPQPIKKSQIQSIYKVIAIAKLL